MYRALVTYYQPLPRQLANFGTRYRHKITGSRSQAPDDMLGGILADDMGLGKTLTMIATIVTTLSRATHFATVIVPSVCQYPQYRRPLELLMNFSAVTWLD
jgi:SNF2 family DNA or RNA helicase